MSPDDIRLLPSAASGDEAAMAAITDLVNKVYLVAEAGMWAGGAARTTACEVAGLTRAGEIAVAVHDDRIVGCVRIQRLDDDLSEFGMLAADPDRHGTGIGRELVRFAERRSRADGAAVMQLELLVPQNRSQPSKDFLAAWYTRLGYRLTRVETIDGAYPKLAPLLATPCDFRIYHKSLTG